MSKGSRPRPISVSQEEYDVQWDAIFDKKKLEQYGPNLNLDKKMLSDYQDILSTEDCILNALKKNKMKLIICLMLFFTLVGNVSSQQIKILHHMSPSGPLSIIINKVSSILSEELKRPIVVESVVGQTGLILMNSYQQRKDTNVYIIAGTSPVVIIPTINKVDYDPTMLDPLVLITISNLCYASKKDMRENDFSKFINGVRGQQKFYGTIGTVTVESFMLDYINKKELLGMDKVDYKLPRDAVIGLLRGDIEMAIIPKSYCANTMLKSLHNVPTKYQITNWFGLFSKKLDDRKSVDLFVESFVRVLNLNKLEFEKSNPDISNFAEKFLIRDDFQKVIDNDRKKWQSIVDKQ